LELKRKLREKMRSRSTDSRRLIASSGSEVLGLLTPVFENRVLRRVFGSRRDEVTGEWRKLHNEERNDLYSLPNIVRVVKSRRMR
jgi:hypothetical protein